MTTGLTASQLSKIAKATKRIEQAITQNGEVIVETLHATVAVGGEVVGVIYGDPVFDGDSTKPSLVFTQFEDASDDEDLETIESWIPDSVDSTNKEGSEHDNEMAELFEALSMMDEDEDGDEDFEEVPTDTAVIEVPVGHESVEDPDWEEDNKSKDL